MSSVHTLPFIYTHFFTASHIIITGEEPGIVLPGLYVDTLTERAEDITLHCSFAQLNEILYCDGEGQDEVTEQLVNRITARTVMPFTIDVTDIGGLECRCMFYCLQQLVPVEEEDKEHLVFTDYYLRGYIKKNKTFLPDPLHLRGNEHQMLTWYLSLLALQYDFYLSFLKEKISNNRALYYSGLQVPLIFHLAKTGYTIRSEG